MRFAWRDRPQRSSSLISPLSIWLRPQSIVTPRPLPEVSTCWWYWTSQRLCQSVLLSPACTRLEPRRRIERLPNTPTHLYSLSTTNGEASPLHVHSFTQSLSLSLSLALCFRGWRVGRKRRASSSFVGLIDWIVGAADAASERREARSWAVSPLISLISL